MPLGDIFNQAALTDVIVRSRAMDNTVPGQSAITGLGARIAPLTDVRTNAVKMRVIEDSTMGLGQFRAPEASYPLVTRNLTAYEQMIELVQLAEKIRVNEIQKMYSVDPNIRADALTNFVTDGQWLLNRNALLTNYMRWKGLEQGYFDITYPSGGSIRVDYGYDAGHSVTPLIDWDDPTATIIDDIEAWKQLIVDDAGVTDFVIHMSTKTWRYLFQNTEFRDALGTDGRRYVFPTEQDVRELAGLTNLVIYDEVYRDDAGATQRFWPENKILITGGGTGYSVGGLRIAEMLNGVVPVSTRSNTEVLFLSGPQAETYLDIESNTEFLRLASARMLRINAPEAIVIATVY